MSVFGTILSFNTDHEDGCAMYVETSPGELIFSGRPCSCGTPSAPIVYEGSHVVPNGRDRRGGWMDLASALDKPFLRLWVCKEGSLEGEVVVVDRRQVQRLHEATGEWLASTEET
jgi:hypothetical protein